MARSIALGIYSVLARAGMPFARWALVRRTRAGKEDPERRDERLGRASLPRPSGPLIWFHAASVGESVSLLGLIERILAGDPQRHVLVTTGTRTSAELMAKRLPDRAMHQYVPVDTHVAVSRFLQHWRPDVAVWTESELWPCLVTRTSALGVPMVLINARISDRSARRLRWLGRYASALLSRFGRILVQDDAVAERLRRLGADLTRVEVTGSLKDTAEPLPHDNTTLATWMKQTKGRTVWLAASTHPGEEELVIEAHRAARRRFPGLLLVLAPRHPERGLPLARTLRADGLEVAVRSCGDGLDRNTEIYLADTLGEMGLWYRAAAASFIGGSLVPIGGHNPFEPALLGSAILYGPHISNFETAYERFQRADAAVLVADSNALAERLSEVLAPDRAAQLAKAAWAVSSEGADVMKRVHDVILLALSSKLVAPASGADDATT